MPLFYPATAPCINWLKVTQINQKYIQSILQYSLVHLSDIQMYCHIHLYCIVYARGSWFQLQQCTKNLSKIEGFGCRLWSYHTLQDKQKLDKCLEIQIHVFYLCKYNYRTEMHWSKMWRGSESITICHIFLSSTKF